MNEYHKILSVYMRDPDNNYRTFLTGQFASPAFEYLQGAAWRGTEKIDGTNIRIIWDGVAVRFGGRTDNAQIPAFLLSALQEHFTPERMAEGLKGPLTLYGEGYGARIQKSGGRYRPDASFILFDAFAGCWLERETVEEIGDALSVSVVPQVFTGTLHEAVDYVKGEPKSLVASDAGLVAEGLVLRPATELCDRLGRRIITKLKCKDFAQETSAEGEGK